MRNPRVAILVDLPRGASAGGHVKYWERVAEAAARQNAPADLTLYFSGAPGEETLGENVRYRTLPPVFSTEKLRFLPYTPAPADLAPFHPQLAEELPKYDVIHATDAYFAFARTAERVAGWAGIPLVTSFHTDTPRYAELFTRATLRHMLGRGLGGLFADKIGFARRERAKKEKRLRAHLQRCAAAFVMREEDRILAREIIGAGAIKEMRLAADKFLFAPQRADKAGLERELGVPSWRRLVLFVGRVDEGKNVPLLIEAVEKAVAGGADLHLLAAGTGPLENTVRERLGDRATLAGQVDAGQLARFYASADCLAMVSDIEIGGLVAIEALACGCPVLCAAANGAAQVLGDPAALRKVEGGAEAWAAALAQFAGDEEGRAALRQAALDFRRDRLPAWGDVLYMDFLPVWQDMLARKEGGACSANAS